MLTRHRQFRRPGGQVDRADTGTEGVSAVGGRVLPQRNHLPAQRRRRAGWACAVIVAAVIGIPAAPAAAVATVTVTPDSGLAAQQTVAVEAFAHGRGEMAGAAQCRTGATLFSGGCASLTLASSSSDDQGNFSMLVSVHRFIAIYEPSATVATIVDCAAAPATCSVATGTADGSSASQPLDFLPQPPPAPPTAAQLVASPTTDLDDGQAVTLEGSRFTPGAPVLVEVCAIGASRCSSLGHAYTDVTGAFLTSRMAWTTVDGVSCVTSGPCVFRVTDITGLQRSSSSLSFGEVRRTLTVEPSARLVDGQSVLVSGDGFPASALTGVAQCSADGAGPSDCGPLVLLDTDADGAFTTTLELSEVLTTPAGQTIDCASESACVVAAANAGNIAATLTKAPISFGPPSPQAKSECRSGGWRGLSDGEGRPFRNQGRCVAWVVFNTRP